MQVENVSLRQVGTVLGHVAVHVLRRTLALCGVVLVNILFGAGVSVKCRQVVVLERLHRLPAHWDVLTKALVYTLFIQSAMVAEVRFAPCIAHVRQVFGQNCIESPAPSAACSAMQCLNLYTSKSLAL